MTVSIGALKSLFIQAPEPMVSGLALYLCATPKPTGSIDLFLKTCGPNNSWGGLDYESWLELDSINWNNWVCGGLASGINLAYVNMFTSGATTISITDNMPLFIDTTGTDSRTNNLTLYLEAEKSDSSYIPLFVKTDDIPSSTIDLYIRGQTGSTPSGYSTASETLYISGARNITASSVMPMYVGVVSTGTLSSLRTAYIKGTTLTVNNINLYLQNQGVENAQYLFIKGYWSVNNAVSKAFGSTATLNVSAGGSNTSSSTSSATWGDSPPVIKKNEAVAGVFNSMDYQLFGWQSRPGARPCTGAIPLYINCMNPTGMLTMYIGDTYTSGGMNMYISGVSGVNGDQYLFIHGETDNNNNIPLWTFGLP